ncbi:D-arabinono-1,4-lactone oxidase [Coemansia sp. RSA 455]|nr:D-arabinono-1,4-lactone oxidase [Coemansia sp. RSA 455]
MAHLLSESERSFIESLQCGARGFEFKNWANTFHCKPLYYLAPETECEVIELVRIAARHSLALKPVGSGHSPSDLACTDSIMLNMDKMNRILAHDPYACTLTVEAGVRLHQLNSMLEQRGMALSNLGSISDQSIAGAIATATHGTGMAFGDMSSTITHLVIIDGTGRRRECSATVDPDLFDAARCSIGALGIITQVTIQCEPAFKLHAVQTPDTLDHVLDTLDEVVFSAEHVRFWWFPYTDNVAVWRANRTTQPIQPHHESLLRDRLYGYYYYQLQLLKARLTPDDIPRIAREHFARRFGRRIETIDDSYTVFNFDCMFPQYVNEWAVPWENAADVLRQLRIWINAEERKPDGVRVHFPVEVRFVRESNVWLSPAYGRAVCYIGVIMYRPYNRPIPYKKYWRVYEDIVRTQGGRPHWAKAHKMYYYDLKKAYPKFDDFIKLRGECDPNGIFVNDYIRRHILPPNEPILTATAPRVLRHNPFDIIKHEISLSQGDNDSVICLDDDEEDESGHRQLVVVGASGDLSDSEPEDSAAADHGAQQDGWSDYEGELDENDPSLYKVLPYISSSQSLRTPDMQMSDAKVKRPVSLGKAVGGPLKSPSMMQVDEEDGWGNAPEPDNLSVLSSSPCLDRLRLDSAGSAAHSGTLQPSTELGVAATEESRPSTLDNAQLAFSRPPESLALRTHVSVTADRPLKELECLREDDSLLSLTSLSGRDQGPLTRIADALVHYEIIGCQASPLTSSAKPTQPAADVGVAPSIQVQQALASLYHLQLESPTKYPFIYLQARDYCVVFKIVVSSSGVRRVAVVSQSYLGLRKLLRGEGVEFSLPLAPKVRTWSEIPGTHDTSGAVDSSDRWLLQTTSFDKSWRSALLIMDGPNVDGLFRHLRSLALDTARLYAPNPFLNATMRRATLRFSSAVAYEDKPSERMDTGNRTTRSLFKLDVIGVVFPSAWNALLMALAELLGPSGEEFCVAAKELSDTAHLNMFVSKQGGSVAGKKRVVCSNGIFTYS